MGGFKDKAGSSPKRTVKVNRDSSSTRKKAPKKVEEPVYDEEEELDEDEEEEFDEEADASAKKAKVIMMGVAGVAVLLIGFVAFNFVGSLFDKDKDSDKDAGNNEPQQTVVDDTPSKEPNELPSTEPNEDPDSSMYSSDTGTDDKPYDDGLVRSQVEPIWAYKSAQDVKDFCNYEKHRCVMGNGLELYWLDCTYKDMPYRIQVAYQTYMLLDVKGIVPVIAEEVTTEDGVKILTNMSVDVDYLKRLKK